MDNNEEISYEDILEMVAENLKKIRASAGINQMEMSEKLKTYQANYSKMEHGVRDIRLISLYYLAAELGINLNWVFNLSNEKFDKKARLYHEKNITKKANRPKRSKK